MRPGVRENLEAVLGDNVERKCLRVSRCMQCYQLIVPLGTRDHHVQYYLHEGAALRLSPIPDE